MKSFVSQYSNKERQLLFFVPFVWGVNLLYYFKAIVLRIPLLNLLADYFVPSVVIISILCCLEIIKSKIRPIDYVFYFSVFFIYILQYLFFPQNSEYLTEGFAVVFFSTLPMYFVGLMVEEDKHCNLLSYISAVSVVLQTIYFYLFTVQSADYTAVGENMSGAYAIFPFVLFLVYSIFKEFKWYKLIVIVIGLFQLLGTGNRGTLLLLLAFTVFYLLLCANLKKHKLTWMLLLLLGASLLFLQNVVFDSLFDLLEKRGLSARTLNFLLDKEFLDDNGRSELSIFFTEKIRDSGFFGYGIMGDRYLLINDENSYPHNLLLELLVQYGIFVGGLLFISLIAITIKVWKMKTDAGTRPFFLMFFTLGILPLFISNSYLLWPYFFLYLGFCVNCLRQSKSME